MGLNSEYVGGFFYYVEALEGGRVQATCAVVSLQRGSPFGIFSNCWEFVQCPYHFSFIVLLNFLKCLPSKHPIMVLSLKREQQSDSFSLFYQTSVPTYFFY